MGNHALRKKVAQELKVAGVNLPLYRGTKRVAYRSLRAGVLRNHLRLLSFKPGDVVNDCDGFNHEIQKVLPWLSEYTCGIRMDRQTYTLQMDQFEFTDGRRSCGCSNPGVVPAWSVAEITSFFHPHTDERIEELKKDGWWTEACQRQEDRVRRGEPLCDERGFRLPEQKEISNV